MTSIPEDIAVLCELLILHYGQDYISDWGTLQELIKIEFDIEIPITVLQAINIDLLEYLDISINLNNCGIS